MDETTVKTLKAVHRLPLADAGEIAMIDGLNERDTYRLVNRLTEAGLITSVPRGTPTLTQSDRYVPTREGIAETARELGISRGELVRRYPVSREWLERLWARLDTVAAVYRVAGTLAQHLSDDSPVDVVLQRSGAFDAVIVMPNGWSLGVIRQGTIAPRRSIYWRIGAQQRLPYDRVPNVTLILAQTYVDANRNQRQGNRRYYGPHTHSFVETEALLNGEDYREWVHLPEGVEERVMSTLDHVWLWTKNDPPVSLDITVRRKRATLPDPERIAADTLGMTLKASEIRVFDVIAHWSGISFDDLTAYLSVTRRRVRQLLAGLVTAAGLVHQFELEGVQRLAPTYDGIRYWTARERSDSGYAFQKWGSNAGDRLRDWEGTSIRTLLGRERQHTVGLHWSVSRIAHAMNNDPDSEFLWSLPTHRNRMRFYRAGYKSLSPDATLGTRREGWYVPYLIEYERSAVHPAVARDRLRLYQHLWWTDEPEVVHGVNPWILFIFPSEKNEQTFIRAANSNVHPGTMRPPVLTSTRPLLEQIGVTGSAWHYLWHEDNDNRWILPTRPS